MAGKPSANRPAGSPAIARKILAQALRLDPRARARIAARLMDSLDGPPDPDAGAAWEKEIARRVAEVKSGKAKFVTWEQVRAKMVCSRRTRR